MVLKNGWLIFNYGTGIANFRASTGRPGISDPSIENIKKELFNMKELNEIIL